MERNTNREHADQLLVVRCQLGERAAFDDLIRRWSGSLHRYALKLSNDPELATVRVKMKQHLKELGL